MIEMLRDGRELTPFVAERDGKLVGFAFIFWEMAADKTRAQTFYDKTGVQAGDWIIDSINLSGGDICGTIF